MEIPKINVRQIKNQRIEFENGVIPMGTLPLLIEGVVNQWEAFLLWEPNYLVFQYGNENVECFVVNKDNRNFLQQVNQTEEMTFENFLKLIAGITPDKKSLRYLRIDNQHSLFESLSKYFPIPNFLENYNPNATGIWMGQKGNLTPFHHDWWHSCLAQVAGKKHFLIVHPLEMAHLMKDWNDAATYDLAPAPYYKSSDERMKKIRTYYEGILEPGQILYIPPFWYHQIETLEDANISLPIRYDTRQTIDVPLLQFSQDSVLRDLTNQKTRDTERLIEYLVINRQHFIHKEKTFVEALAKTRNLKVSVSEMIAAIEREKSLAS